ncbi:MAG TPA: BON domain-containing protein [Chloroflexota bacterium]|nr:BON domain-containing protein [Chloroflexota bacterium]
MGVLRGLTLALSAGLILVWAVTRQGARGPRSVVDLSTDLRHGLQVGGIRWSGGFLRSMGAVESASRAELDALRAERIAHALTERLKDGAANVKAVIIGEIVHLEGSVKSERERAEAESVAREVSGAQVTANDLRVE